MLCNEEPTDQWARLLSNLSGKASTLLKTILCLARHVPGQTASQQTDNHKVPTCYRCGEKGPKKPDCPQKIRRIRSPQPKGQSIIYIAGKIGDIVCTKLVVESGTDLTTLHPDFIPRVFTLVTTQLSPWQTGLPRHVQSHAQLPKSGCTWETGPSTRKWFFSMLVVMMLC